MSLSEALASHDSIKEAIRRYPKLKKKQQLEIPTLAVNRYLFAVNTQEALKKTFQKLKEMTEPELKEYFSDPRNVRLIASNFLLSQCVEYLQKSEDENVKLKKENATKDQEIRILENKLTVLRTEKELEELRKQ